MPLRAFGRAMPELPEVEFARGCLERWLGGEVIANAEADPTRVVRGSSRAAFAKLTGRRVTSVERRGKWLLMRFDGELGLLMHLGMTGKFELARPSEAEPRWSRARLARADGSVVHYRDPRLLGRLLVAPLAELLGQPPLAELGPDAWKSAPTPTELARRLSRRRRPIKDVLMDQTIIAGLGNIQVTEALFLARIHPSRRADRLSIEEVRRLSRAVRTSLSRTMAMNSGDKIKYVEETKRIENPFHIYGKAGAPCPRCATTVRKLTISGRTSAFCPSCQPKKLAGPNAIGARLRVRQATARKLRR
jgi:formamidopyrimidine-DNA glycosylase